MQQITQVSCGDQYTNAATISEVFNSSGGYFTVGGNDVLVELQYGQLGQFNTTNEAPVPVGNGILQAGTTGVRFRNLTAGATAVVTAALYAEDEPALIITAGGLATPNAGTMVTGILASGGGTTAGTGFTATRTGTGAWTVTYSSAFAAQPVVLTQYLGPNNSFEVIMDVFGSTMTGFSLQIRDPSGTALDSAWNFIADAVS